MFPLKDNIPTDRFPVVTVALLAINVFVYFVLQQPDGLFGGPDDRIVLEWGSIPYEVTHPGEECGFAEGAPGGIACEGQPGVSGTPPDQPPFWVTIFTSMFMHGGLLHLGGNMLFLWIFGSNIEDSMGRVRFVAFYLLAGVAALGLQIVVGPDEAIPTIGASGAIAGVLGGYAILYPRARVVTLIFIILFFTIVELRAALVLGVWFIIQFAYGALDLTSPTGGSGGVAYFAHIGGFAFGMAAIRLFVTRVKDLPFGGAKYPVY